MVDWCGIRLLWSLSCSMIHNHHIIENRDGKRFRTNTTIPLSVEGHCELHKEYWEKWGFREDWLAYKSLSKQIGKDEIFFETSRIGGLNNRGIKKSEEHRRKLSEANKGMWTGPHSEERKRKISEAMKGNKSSKNHSSSEYKKTQSEAMKKAWKKRKNKVTN